MTLKDLTAVSLAPITVCSLYDHPAKCAKINNLFKGYSGLLNFEIVKLGVFPDGTFSAMIDVPPETIEHLQKITADPTKK